MRTPLTPLLIVVLICSFALPASGQNAEQAIEEFSQDLEALQHSIRQLQEGQVTPTIPEAELDAITTLGGEPSIAATRRPTELKIEPFRGSDRIGQIPAGAEVAVIGREGNFAQLHYESNGAEITGWAEVNELSVASASSIADIAIGPLVRQAHGLQQRWQNNEYVAVSGFTVSLFPPSINVSFAFRDSPAGDGSSEPGTQE